MQMSLRIKNQLDVEKFSLVRRERKTRFVWGINVRILADFSYVDYCIVLSADTELTNQIRVGCCISVNVDDCNFQERIVLR